MLFYSVDDKIGGRLEYNVGGGVIGVVRVK